MLIALDLSTRATGFAFGGVDDDAPKGGTWTMPGADELVFDQTLSGIIDSVSALIRMTGAKRVCIEQYLMPNIGSNSHTIASLIQLTGAARGAAKRAGCQVTLIASSTVRKYFIGSGIMKSDQAKSAVKARCRELGWNYTDDNHSDANAVWAWGMSKFHPAWASQKCPILAAGFVAPQARSA